MVWAPQDVPDYVGDVTMQQLTGDKDAGIKESVARQRAWLKRGPDTQPSSWRPRKRQRRAAWMWLNCLHNMLLTLVATGLLYYIERMDKASRDYPELWPRLSISPDMGSDGVSSNSLSDMFVLSVPTHLNTKHRC